MGCLCVSPEDDILLEVEALYYLRLDFPADVDEDSASAVFNKKKRTLTLKVDASGCRSAPQKNWNQPRLCSHSLWYLLRPSRQHCNVRFRGWTRECAASAGHYLITTSSASLYASTGMADAITDLPTGPTDPLSSSFDCLIYMYDICPFSFLSVLPLFSSFFTQPAISRRLVLFMVSSC